MIGRRVYVLSGFDPRGARFYHRLFSEQVRQLQRRTGRPLQLGHRKPSSHRKPPSQSQASTGDITQDITHDNTRDPLLSRWPVLEGGQPRLEIGFLHWDDIARSHWPRNPLRLLWDGLGIYGWYLLGGGYRRLQRWSRRVALCGLYPMLYAATAALLLALASGLLLAQGWSWPPLVTAALLLALLVGGTWQSWRWAEAIGVVWLFRSIRFTHRLGQARDHDLRERVAALAERLLAVEATEPAAEVWLLGHSSGSFVMAMLAAELRRRGMGSPLAQRLRLLSLGQNLANLAVHGKARRFHADLALLAEEPRIPWLDITSRDDFLCFAGVDPYRSCGVPRDGEAYPELRLIPLAQRQGLATLVELLSHQFDLHFEYLRTAAPECSGGFDLIEQLLAP